MVLGAVVGAVGTGLLTTIDLDTSTVEWASYLVITGIGIGFGINIPYTAVQVVLRFVFCAFPDDCTDGFPTSKDDLPIGNGKSTMSTYHTRHDQMLTLDRSCHGLLHPTWRVSEVSTPEV